MVSIPAPANRNAGRSARIEPGAVFYAFETKRGLERCGRSAAKKPGSEKREYRQRAGDRSDFSYLVRPGYRGNRGRAGRRVEVKEAERAEAVIEGRRHRG